MSVEQKETKGNTLKVKDLGRMQGSMCTLDLDEELNIDGGFSGDLMKT